MKKTSLRMKETIAGCIHVCKEYNKTKSKKKRKHVYMLNLVSNICTNNQLDFEYAEG
jgi:hypothetical protein